MRHPWVTRREGLMLTQLEVANYLQLNRQSVIRLEQGLFHSPSVEVLVGLGALYSAPVGDLIREYDDFVKATRETFAGRYPDFRFLRNYSGLTHPLVAYRESNDLTRMGLCRGLCLDYGPVADYEYNKQRGIPLELKRACEDIKWDWSILEEEVVLWRQSGRADKRANY